MKKRLEIITLFGEDGFGWEERKKRLAHDIPFPLSAMLENEFEYLKKFNFEKVQLEPAEQNELLKIYNRVFNQKHEASSCRTCWVSILYYLQKMFYDYKNKL